MKLQIQTRIPPHILAELEAKKPSIEPSYWAKPSCGKCYGRGIIGNIKKVVGDNNTISQPLLCGCVQKRYGKWLEQKYEEHKKAKADLRA